MALIDVDDLSFRYPRARERALDRVTTTFGEGERVAVLAPNGGGKTTFARLVAGLLPEGVIAVEHGEVRMDGIPLVKWPPAERAAALQFVGQVPSQQLTGAAFSVAEEIAFGPANLGLPAAEVRARVDESLAICNLERLAARDPFSLSGGEQQRLSIGAALAMRPRVLVLDEPTSNLDPASRDAFIEQLAVLPKSLTVVVFEVALRPCIAMARRFILLDAGRIVAEGSARDVLDHPRCVAQLSLTPLAQAARTLRDDGYWPRALALPLTLADGRAAFDEARRALR